MRPWFFLQAMIVLSAGSALAADPWTVGTPIVTYYAGPTMSDKVARQMKEGNFNVVWCSETQLDLLKRHGLRGMVHDGLLNPAVLDKADQKQKLDDMIERRGPSPNDRPRPPTSNRRVRSANAKLCACGRFLEAGV